MAHKVSSGIKGGMPEGSVSIKFVKRARMWCKTFFKNGKQIQEWTQEKPDATYPAD